MADRLKGITLEIGGDTQSLSKSLKNVNSDIRNTQSQLKDVQKLLKLDPANTELLRQKQQLLKAAVSETKEKLDALKKAQETMDANGVDKNSEQYITDGIPGDFGRGAYGGDGAPGCILVYY